VIKRTLGLIAPAPDRWHVPRTSVVSGLGPRAFQSSPGRQRTLRPGIRTPSFQKRPATHVQPVVSGVRRSAGPHGWTAFLVLSAIGCYDCDDMTHIYIALVSDAGLQTDQTPYSYPGAITPLESDTVVFRSRLFMGRCLNSPTELLLWFQDQRDSWESGTTRVPRPGSERHPRPRSHATPVPSLEATVRRVQSGHCRELPPRDQVEY